jgi:serine/threonine protein kinase/Tfp pilus assembly protein PilF
LYARLVEHSEQPTPAELEALCALHPELAEELRALNKTRWLLEELGREASATRTSAATVGQRTDAEVHRLEGYEILRCLGRGGMGEVWEAFDRTLGRRVALKLLAPLASHSDRERERLRREALAAARLRHPNVVALFSAGEHAGRPYLVQELVEGGRTLRDEIEELRRLGSVPEGYERCVAERFVALADALSLAHSQGIVHRDIKPQNILLEPDGRPKLADFGLAKTVGDASLSLTGEFVGTYLYASPEQVTAGRTIVGPASDVFSLGATLYECLTLERPFGGDSLQAIAREILHEDPAPPRTLRPRIDRDLSVICLHMLEKRPEARYASMDALRDDLRRYLSGALIQARPPSSARRVQRAVQRHPTMATAVVLSATAFVAILVLLGRTKKARDDLAFANERLIGANSALESARAQAQTEADTSAETVAFLSDLFYAGDPLEYGSEPSLKDVILKGTERLRSGEVTDPNVRATLLGELGVLLSRLGHWSEAESLLTESSALFRDLGRWDTREGVQTRVALAVAYWDQGRNADCRALLEPLLEHTRPPSELPDETCFEVLSAMGFVLSESGDPVAGEARLREAMELAQRLPDSEQFRVRSVRVSLSTSLLRQGKREEAAELIEPLCTELAPLLPHGNTVALDAFNVRGRVRLERGQLQEALADFESGLSAAEAKLGMEHPRSINFASSLATCFIALQRWDEAEQLLRHAIESSAAALGADSRESLTALSNLGTVLIGTGRYAEAEEVLRWALDMELAQSGEDHLRTAMVRSNLAICLFHLQRYGEAAEQQERALASVSPQTAEYPDMERSLAIYRNLAAKN